MCIRDREQVVWPVRAYKNVQVIGGKRTERMVFTLPKFTLADDKQLVVELHEQQGGRHPVSYTHLDVYKRQGLLRRPQIGA